MKIKFLSVASLLLVFAGVTAVGGLSGCAINPATTQQTITEMTKDYGDAEKAANDAWYLGLITPQTWTKTIEPDFQKAATAIDAVETAAALGSQGDWFGAVTVAISAGLQISSDQKLLQQLPAPGTTLQIQTQPPPTTLPSLN